MTACPECNARIRRFAQIAAILAAASALIVLVGWGLGVSALAAGAPGLVAMNPLTAVLLLLAAASLWLLSAENLSMARRAVACGLSAITALAGGWVVLAYLGGWEAAIDQLLFASQINGNRMAPNTALHFVLIGLALLTLDAGAVGSRTSQALAMTASLGALVSLVGYGYGAKTLYGIGSYTPMALNTAAVLEFLAVGILCARPQRGVIAILTVADMGGVMARRLLPAAILIPCILGLFRVLGQRAGFYDTEFGAAMMVVITVAMLVGAVVVTAGALNRTDAERRRAQDAVQLYSDVVRQLPIGLTIWHLEELQDSRSLRFVSANQASSDLLGVELASLTGRTMLESFPAVPDTHLAVYADVARSGQGCQVLEVVYGDDRVAANTWSVKAFPLPDRCVGLAFENISERKAAERRIRQLNEQLEQRVAERTTELASANRDLLQKNQENEMFVYSVSHDLRSPLVSLQGFSKELGLTCGELRELLAGQHVPEECRKRASGLLDGGMQQSIRFIQTAVIRLSNIIDALLRLSRAGRVELQLKPVDVNGVVSRVVESTGLARFDGAVELRVQDLPPCCGDASALEQVFDNLITNAIKYRDPQRTCEITVGSLSNSTLPDHSPSMEQHVYFVRDTGLGVPAASREKIFQAFKRAHPHVATGDGMGLAIVQRIVQRHGGKVWVESEEGKGSTFYVALPARLAPQVAALRVVPNKEGVTRYVSRTDGDFAGRR